MRGVLMDLGEASELDLYVCTDELLNILALDTLNVNNK